MKKHSIILYVSLVFVLQVVVFVPFAFSDEGMMFLGRDMAVS